MKYEVVISVRLLAVEILDHPFLNGTSRASFLCCAPRFCEAGPPEFTTLAGVRW